MLIALLDDLQVLPARQRLFARGRTPPSLILGHLTIDLDHGVADPAPAIRNGWGRHGRMTAFFERLKDKERGGGFALGNATGHPQSGIHIAHRRVPELTVACCLGIRFSSPLLPTYDQWPSICPRSNAYSANKTASTASAWSPALRSQSKNRLFFDAFDTTHATDAHPFPNHREALHNCLFGCLAIRKEGARCLTECLITRFATIALPPLPTSPKLNDIGLRLL